MSTNVSQEFTAAQKKYLQAYTDEEKLLALEEMMSAMPSHKGAENLRADIRGRYKRLKEKIEQKVKQKKSTARKLGIKKEGVQIVLIGLSGAGKSSLLASLTNATPEISNHLLTTKFPVIGALDYQGIKFQIIDMPAINYEDFDQGLANTADILLIMISSLQDLEKILPFLDKAAGKRILAFNKSDLLSPDEKRKISSFLQSKKYNFLLLSTKTKENLEDLKQLFIKNSGVIRIYTKQPGKPHDFSPVILKPETTAGELAGKLFPKSIIVKEIRITGPSSKFPNQQVGLEHVLKDKDIVEFHTR